MPATASGSRALSLRPRPSAITIRDNSPTSSWINFLRDEVSPLLKEREHEITIYPSPVGFKNAKAKSNYIENLKNVLEEIPETEREKLKQEKIDKDLACWSWLQMRERMRKKNRNSAVTLTCRASKPGTEKNSQVGSQTRNHPSEECSSLG